MSSEFTPTAYYLYHIFDRRNEISTILGAQRLFQQFLVVTYCTIKKESLWYLRLNQNRLRAAEYTSLIEYLGDIAAAVEEGEDWRAGGLITLPTTPIVVYRHTRQQMLDIIAICKKIGHRDNILTMSYNPKWKEISEPLLPGQTAPDQSNIRARVFS